MPGKKTKRKKRLMSIAKRKLKVSTAVTERPVKRAVILSRPGRR